MMKLHGMALSSDDLQLQNGQVAQCESSTVLVYVRSSHCHVNRACGCMDHSGTIRPLKVPAALALALAHHTRHDNGRGQLLVGHVEERIEADPGLHV
jgi:hypothetical protein